MTYNVQFIIDAERDLGELYDYLYANDSQEAADAILDKIIAACASLAELPSRGHYTPEMVLMGAQAYREIRVGVHRLIYEIRESTVYVHAVLDSRRDLRDLLLARLVR